MPVFYKTFTKCVSVWSERTSEQYIHRINIVRQWCAIRVHACVGKPRFWNNVYSRVKNSYCWTPWGRGVWLVHQIYLIWQKYDCEKSWTLSEIIFEKFSFHKLKNLVKKFNFIKISEMKIFCTKTTQIRTLNFFSSIEYAKK